MIFSKIFIQLYSEKLLKYCGRSFEIFNFKPKEHMISTVQPNSGESLVTSALNLPQHLPQPDGLTNPPTIVVGHQQCFEVWITHFV
jgi:hypothetical protein